MFVFLTKIVNTAEKLLSSYITILQYFLYYLSPFAICYILKSIRYFCDHQYIELNNWYFSKTRSVNRNKAGKPIKLTKREKSFSMYIILYRYAIKKIHRGIIKYRLIILNI